MPIKDRDIRQGIKCMGPDTKKESSKVNNNAIFGRSSEDEDEGKKRAAKKAAKKGQKEDISDGCQEPELPNEQGQQMAGLRQPTLEKLKHVKPLRGWMNLSKMLLIQCRLSHKIPSTKEYTGKKRGLLSSMITVSIASLSRKHIWYIPRTSYSPG